MHLSDGDNVMQALVENNAAQLAHSKLVDVLSVFKVTSASVKKTSSGGQYAFPF